MRAYLVLLRPACRTVLNALRKLASTNTAKNPTTAAKINKTSHSIWLCSYQITQSI